MDNELPIESDLPKLIRDNIPEIISAVEGIDPKVRATNNDDEYLKFLLKKAVEEATELQHSALKDNMKEELADLLEIIETLIKQKGWTIEEIKQIQTLKRNKNGGFQKRLLLLSK